MENNDLQLGTLLNVNVGEMIHAIATGIADAQFKLDKSSMTVAEFMSGQRMIRDLDTGALLDAKGNPSNEPVTVDSRIYFGYEMVDGKKVAQKLSMMELGFVPTFYQFVDTVIELRVALTVTKTQQGQTVVSASTVDAGYVSTYGYKLEAASLIKTKLVPIPPPALLEERIRASLSTAKL